ncbi:FRIGIDA-like protein 4a [Nicotiana tomentosiformis]|uniref:FRIGIDA-like protein 4a n=1 Tax=Nicotiana tomentosiformis TaxID=4098 RepID=UPI00051BF099|nr:FRIGIDA-like protein 4a [Nicotiana tomentosiformis]
MAADTATNPDRIHAFFSNLESRKTLLATVTDLHKTLTTHFTNIDKTLSQKSETLDNQIKSFKENTENALLKLQNRENALPDIESGMAAFIADKKDAALSEIENAAEGLGDLSEKSLAEVLRIYCRRMDASGLVRFLQTKRKESTGLRTEIVAALDTSVDPMRLILDAAEEFVGMKVEEKMIGADRRWACDMLVQSVGPVVEGGYGAGRSLKERAARVLEKWKGVLGSGDRTSGVCAAEATMFLQLVISFALKERFEEEFLRKLVMEFANRKDMPKLAVAFGFGNKIVDIIEELVKSGKEVEAVYFAYESGLAERFPPVSLLKAYLRNCRRNSNNISKKGRFSSAAVDKANIIEWEATKAIIKCVEDHKLEQEFSLEGLKKRVTELEQSRAKRKKGTAPGHKHSKKRGRGSGSGKAIDQSTSRPVKSGRLSNASPSFRSRNPPPSHQVPPVRYTGAHSYTSQSVYEAPSTVSYAPAYSGTHTTSPAALPPQYGYAIQETGAYSGTHTQSTAALPPQYGYALQEAGVSGVRSYPGSYGGQSGYSAYDYTLTATASAYPPSYPPQ